MSTPCGRDISAGSEHAVDSAEADALLARARRLYAREMEAGFSGEMAMERVEHRLRSEAKTMELLAERNRLLSLRAKLRVKAFVRQFPTFGEGLQALLEGSNKKINGARFSVDYQSRATFGKYFGRFVATLDEHGLAGDFMRNEHVQDVYRELWELGKEGGSVGRTGNDKAVRIAQAIHDVGREMVARQNQAGAYIRLLPGYVMRQTHDVERIRHLGGFGTSAESQSRSYRAWRDFILPLLDHNATFEGLDPEFVLRNVHQGLYSGFHGPDPDMATVAALPYKGSHAGKVSRERVLHFKDADSAYAYNQAFGMKSLRDQITGDMRFRSRSIALMENFGPAPRQLFDVLRGELHAEARAREDAATQVESLGKWSIDAAFNELTGHNDHPLNHTLARVANNTRLWTSMAKMGGVVLSSFGDKAFIQAESAFQGISGLQTLGAQITGMFSRTPDQTRALRLMGVALDGLLGQVMGRYSNFRPISGGLHWAQKRFFDLNFLNWWTDANKATMAELMSAHLAEHADLPHANLPEDLKNVLSLYDINEAEWDLMRGAMWEVAADGRKFLSPDQMRVLSDEDLDATLTKMGRRVSRINREALRSELETKLRTYLVDRVDYAVPSPGIAEQKFATLGTRAGTPLGEAVRMVMMFKSFPITIMHKIGGREVYGHGASTFAEWLRSDHRGKFNMAMIIAFAGIGGYLSGAIKDALKGRKPKPLVTDDKVNWSTLNDAMLRGGGLGIMGDILFQEYDRQGHSFLGTMAGPIVGQLDPLADMATKLRKGENIGADAVKFTQSNLPFMNLFYIKPVLDYFVLWSLQEAMSPGSLKRTEQAVEKRGQDFFLKPSEVTK